MNADSFFIFRISFHPTSLSLSEFVHDTILQLSPPQLTKLREAFEEYGPQGVDLPTVRSCKLLHYYKSSMLFILFHSFLF